MSVFEPSGKLMRTIEHEIRDRGFRLKHLTRGISRLSDRFVREEGPFGEYLLLPEQLASYAAYYLPINLMKVRWVLEELARYAPGFLDAPRRVGQEQLRPALAHQHRLTAAHRPAMGARRRAKAAQQR